MAQLTPEEMGRKGGAANVKRHDHEHFVAIGKKGGAAIVKRYGREHFAALGKKGAAARHGKRENAG